MTNLVGQHAIVTGGGTGLGAAIALALSDAGAMVTICGRRSEPLQKTAEQSENIYTSVADISSETDVTRLFAEATERATVTIVVANAGLSMASGISDTTLEQWQQMIDVNLTGAFLTAREATRVMNPLKPGRIIFIASTAGQKGYPFVTGYCASKHGVIGLTRSLAMETARSKLTVNAICPGYSETDMLDQAVNNIMQASGRSAEQSRQRLSRTNPQGRFVQPDEVADAVLWLCRPQSSAITGQAVSVSGGET